MIKILLSSLLTFTSPCKITPSDWFGNIGKTTTTLNNHIETESFVFIREAENTFCTYGQKSGKYCFYRAGSRLFRSKKFKKVYGFIKESGMIVWSKKGWKSHLKHPCGMKTGVTCTVGVDNLVGRGGRTWRTNDGNQTTVETVEVEKTGGKFCFVGNETGRVCASYDEKKRRFASEKVSWITGTMHPNGQILWSNGFSTQMKGDLCRDYSNSQVGNENERKEIKIIKENDTGIALVV